MSEETKRSVAEAWADEIRADLKQLTEKAEAALGKSLIRELAEFGEKLVEGRNEGRVMITNLMALTWGEANVNCFYNAESVRQVVEDLRRMRQIDGARLIRTPAADDTESATRYWSVLVTRGEEKARIDLNVSFPHEGSQGAAGAKCRMVKVGEEAQPPRPVYMLVCDGDEPENLPTQVD